MEIGKDFANIKAYTDNMAKGLQDKLFFLDELTINREKSYLFVDFGCADGVMISTLYNICNTNNIEAYFIGYDISDAMVNLAKTKFEYKASNVLFTSSWNEVEYMINKHLNMESILILSSVIHEVYSYAKSSKDIDIFWDRALKTGFKYICIRDMSISNKIKGINIDEYTFKRITNHSFPQQLKEFQEKWGDINLLINALHFLLKYRWTINWKRELNENYFPIYTEDLIKIITGNNYNINYLKKFRVPFLDKCWDDDFHIKIEDYTHIKLIFQKNK